MKKFIFIFSLISATPLFAQVDKIDSLLNDLVYNDSDPLEMPEKPVKFDFIYTAVNYNSNSFYAGREIGSKMVNITGNLFYYNMAGFFIGVSGSWYDQLTPAYSNTTISAGYGKSVDKKRMFTIRTSYNRFIYYKPDTGIIYPYNNSFNLGLTFRKKWIGARIGSNLLFGEESKINFSTAIYSRFTLIKFGRNCKFYTAPEISAFFSTETVNAAKTDGQNTDIAPVYKDVFGLLNTQIYIPVGLSAGNLDFEFSCSLNMPTTSDVYVSYPIKYYYGFSVGYLLPIPK